MDWQQTAMALLLLRERWGVTATPEALPLEFRKAMRDAGDMLREEEARLNEEGA
jgi:hypothetical protein